jgi:uncharacterized protein YjbI with pentapeptide repeats
LIHRAFIADGYDSGGQNAQDKEPRVEQQGQSSRRPILWAGVIVALAFLVIVICGYLFGWKWTGLVKDANFPNRTLWDWMELLIIPAVLAGGGIWFNRQQRQHELRIDAQQREREQDIAKQRAQDEALQAYLDQMSQLLTDQGLRSKTHWLDEARITARARSLAALRRLDGEHRKSVLQFLSEAQLINRRERTLVEGETQELGPARIVGLSGVDLRSADLRYINLSDVALNGALLDNADLREAELMDIDLGGANLSGADLSDADLRDAHLENADLRKAKLNGVDLGGADLSGADLSNAKLRSANLANADLQRKDERRLNGANLSGADLSGVIGITNEQLEQQAKTLKGAIMPNGLMYS